jgi:metallo-beta-lactamase family protein
MTAQIKFCGAAGTVTGSCYWMRTQGCQFLIDCGLFQGTKTIKELNYGDFPFDPKKIDFVLLTHAHTDHAAMIPKLIKAGFAGPVYATAPTKDLLSFMLPDSGNIQETEVDRLNRRNQQRGKGTVTPIYTRRDAENSINQIKAIDYEKWLIPDPDIRARFWNAGHILGSASIEIEISDEERPLRILFSGDLGPDNKLFQADPEAPSDFDYIVCESTYGGQTREIMTPQERRSNLANEINAAMSAGGSLIIPSFAVERSQELLLDIALLIDSSEISSSTVFLDSPLAIRITSIFEKYSNELEDLKDGKLPFLNPKFHFTETTEESKSIARIEGGAIIMSASGMCDAGRVRHHLKNHLWRPQSTILLVGYQAKGTLGWLLEQGLKNIKIQGEAIRVRARIRKIDTYSAHADGNELISWIKARVPIKEGIFLTHGSRESLDALRADLLAEGYSKDMTIVPALDEEFELRSKGQARKLGRVSKRIMSKTIDKLDWHNELAQLTLDLRSALEHIPDDRKKSNLLKELRQNLEKSKYSLSRKKKKRKQ